MATCGYLCPACSGTRFNEDNEPCTWCAPLPPQKNLQNTISDQDWINSVHQGPCCSDLGS